MKQLPMLAFLTAASAISLSAPAHAANVIVNGDFESGSLGPWYEARNFFGSPWGITSADANTGNFSATNIGNVELRQDFAGVSTDSVTSVTFALRHANFATAPTFVSFFYGDGSSTGFGLNTSSTDWQTFDVLGNLDAGKILTGFSIFGYAGGSTPDVTALDDVVINVASAVPEPGTWAMMILGFFAVGAALRRNPASTTLSVSYS